MAKLFSNQTTLLLWAGRGVGRACTLALARNGARVLAADPDPEALHKLTDLLKSKDAEAVALPWRTQSGGVQEYGRETSRILDEVRTDTPFLHRIVLTLGIDERFFPCPLPGQEEECNRIARLETIVETCTAELQKQSRPGALDVFWHAEDAPEVTSDPAAEALIRSGLECLRRQSARAASTGVAMSILRVRALERRESDNATSGGGAGRLRPGEIGEALVQLASMPKNLVIPEVLLSPRGK